MTKQQKIERLLQSFADNRRAMAKHIQSDSTITKAQYEVLWQIKGGVHRVVDMAANLQTSTSAATQLVQQLVESGLVERQTSPTDRREAVLNLTTFGQQVLQQFHTIMSNWAEGVVSCLSDQELDQYLSITAKINEYLRQKEV